MPLAFGAIACLCMAVLLAIAMWLEQPRRIIR